MIHAPTGNPSFREFIRIQCHSNGQKPSTLVQNCFVVASERFERVCCNYPSALFIFFILIISHKGKMHPLEVENTSTTRILTHLRLGLRLIPFPYASLFLLDYNIMTLLIKAIMLLSSIVTSVTNDFQTTPETLSFVTKRPKRITSAI